MLKQFLLVMFGIASVVECGTGECVQSPIRNGGEEAGHVRVCSIVPFGMAVEISGKCLYNFSERKDKAEELQEALRESESVSGIECMSGSVPSENRAQATGELAVVRKAVGGKLVVLRCNQDGTGMGSYESDLNEGITRWLITRVNSGFLSRLTGVRSAQKAIVPEGAQWADLYTKKYYYYPQNANRACALFLEKQQNIEDAILSNEAPRIEEAVTLSEFFLGQEHESETNN